MSRAVLFDLDGTLVDSLPDIAAALNVALASVGIRTLTLAEAAQCVGEGARHLVAQALPDGERSPARIDDVLSRYRAAYRARLVVHTRPYPGILPLVAALRASGRPLAVVTNKPEGPATEIVAQLFPAGTFGVVVGESEGRPRKPDPFPARLALERLGARGDDAIFVGDSAVDLETARRANLRGIGVSWGIRGRAELEAVGSGEIVETVEALAVALDRS